VSNVGNVQPLLTSFSFDKVYTNVQSEFYKLFNNAENVRWNIINRNYGVTFGINDLRYRVLLNPKGKLIYKITYGKEKQLPKEIRKMVKGRYVEFIITAVSLVEEADRKIWVINLEDDSEYVIARVENNEIGENMRYTKAGLQ
jgi:hypothetical protein